MFYSLVYTDMIKISQIGSFYPRNKKADYTCVGENENEGYRLNIPWNT